MLDFRVNTFLTVCESGNYTKAAEKLGLTQPAVTQHIKFLEDRYKVRLFVKEGKNMRLTGTGEIMRDMFTTLNADCQKIDRRIKKLNGEPKSLIIGVINSIGEYVLPSILKKYLEREPEAKISIEIGNTDGLLDMLKKGRADFLISEGKFDKNTYCCKLFSREKFICLCSVSSELAGKSVFVEGLFPNRLFLGETGSGTREILENNLRQTGYSADNFSSVTEIGSLNAIKALVADNYGISFMFEVAAAEELKTGRLKKVDIKGFDICHDFNFVCLKDTMFMEDFNKFFDFAVNNI